MGDPLAGGRAENAWCTHMCPARALSIYPRLRAHARLTKPLVKPQKKKTRTAFALAAPFSPYQTQFPSFFYRQRGQRRNGPESLYPRAHTMPQLTHPKMRQNDPACPASSSAGPRPRCALLDLPSDVLLVLALDLPPSALFRFMQVCNRPTLFCFVFF
ncbi:hypothetical protein BC828DRAFT_50242 [Blastocladiella britannica]|nr:hypothetical protein BC828DRAFT_50242 [Blastocladiella britannica]